MKENIKRRKKKKKKKGRNERGSQQEGAEKRAAGCEQMQQRTLRWGDSPSLKIFPAKEKRTMTLSRSFPPQINVPSVCCSAFWLLQTSFYF